MKISIITATYNSAQTISDCIASVNNQTFQDIEHIIVDGNSSDDFDKLIYSQPNRVKEIVTVSKELNIYDALNMGIELATGDIIGFLHSDDFFESNDVIEKVASAFETSGADIVYGNILYVGRKNRNKIIRTWISNPFKYKDLRKGWMPPHTSFYAKRDVYKKYGIYNSTFDISADYDLMSRFLGEYKLHSFYLNITFVRMGYGGTSTKFSNHFKRWAEDYKVIRMNKIGGLYTLFLKSWSKIDQLFKR